MVFHRSIGVTLLAGLGLFLPAKSISQESLSDIPSFREGCQALEDERYGTAAEHFLATWEALLSADAGEVEKEFVATRLLETWVKNDEAGTAVHWLEKSPLLDPSPARLHWMAIAFQSQLRFSEAAEIYGVLRGLIDEPSSSLSLDHAFCLSMSGDLESAREILNSMVSPANPEECLQTALIAGKLGDHENALRWLKGTGDLISAGNKLHLTSWHLVNLGRVEEASNLILDAFETETDPALRIQKILLLNELEQLGNIQVPRERIEAWASQRDSPLYEGAELFLALEEGEGLREERLQSWLRQFPRNPFSDQVRLLLGLAPTLERPEGFELDEFLQKRKSSRATEDYLAERYETARKVFLDLAESGPLENRYRSLFNAAVAALKQENFEDFLLHESELKRKLPKSQKVADLTYLAGLFRASRAEPDALGYLESFIRENPTHPNRVEAQLALAEIHLNQAPARPQAARQIFESLETQILNLEQSERLDYTKVWLEIIDNNESGFIELAETFRREWPGSRYFAEVSMLLAKKLYEDNRLEEARPVFARIATDFPDSAFSEIAPLFAAKSTTEDNESILAWKTIAYREGPYATEGLHELGLLLVRMDRFEEARTTFRELVERTSSGTELHYAALADIGHAYYLEALAKDQDEALMGEAAKAFSQLARLPDAPEEWKYAAALRRARCLESVGNEEVALEIYRSIVSNSADPVLRNTLPGDVQAEEWVFRAGFFAIQILRRNEDWLAAIQMADELSKKNGPRAIEAANLAERLRLENWIWD